MGDNVGYGCRIIFRPTAISEPQQPEPIGGSDGDLHTERWNGSLQCALGKHRCCDGGIEREHPIGDGCIVGICDGDVF